MKYKCYNDKGTLLAQTVHAEDAAMIIGNWGHGGVIKVSNEVVWCEGLEPLFASDSYDEATAIIHQRVKERKL